MQIYYCPSTLIVVSLSLSFMLDWRLALELFTFVAACKSTAQGGKKTNNVSPAIKRRKEVAEIVVCFCDDFSDWVDRGP